MCAIFGCASAPSAPRTSSDERAMVVPASRSGAQVQAPAAHVEAAAQERFQSPALVAFIEPASVGDLPWLSPSHVGAAVRAHHGDFQACQALGDVLARREDGAVTVGWAVKANGSVNRVTLGTSTFDSDSINDCVLSVARQVTFPPSAAPTQVSWTVEFRGASSHEPLADATLR